MSVVRTFISDILKIDPDFYYESSHPIEYEFSNGRKFRGAPGRGAYAEDED